MPYTLVVVDMQYGFFAANQQAIKKNVVNQIKRAIKRGLGIVVLQMRGGGRILAELQTILNGYDRVDYAIKSLNDGSPEAYASITENCFYDSEIRICGVNTSACIMETAIGLSDWFEEAKIKVIEDSCNCYDSNDFGWIQSRDNLFLLERQ